MSLSAMQVLPWTLWRVTGAGGDAIAVGLILAEGKRHSCHVLYVVRDVHGSNAKGRAQMKKWYLVGLLVLAVALVASFAVACETEEATETTAAVETTAAPTTEETEATETTAAAIGTEIGLFFEDKGNNVVNVIDVPAPGMQFPVHTTPADDYACTIEAFDAAGASLGNLETADGLVDYSALAGTVAKIVVTTFDDRAFEYMVP